MMKKSTMNIKGRMEREGGEEDLSLFRELRKRQSERVSGLLQFASEDYDFDSNNPKFSLYRVPSGKKENEYLVETNKTEYDWLKTPPATPLFPSLEMEPNAHLVLQKEIPISQLISRFAGNDEKQLKSKPIIDAKPKPNLTNSSKAKIPMRSITPSHNRQRPTTSITKNNNTNTNNEHKQLPNIHHHNHNNIITKRSIIDAKIEYNNTNSIAPQKQQSINNPKKSMEANESLGMKAKTRGVSSSVRSTRIASNFVLDLDLPNEAPPNLRTERRASSTTRGRSTTRGSKLVGTHNQDPIPRSIVRPSRSPSPCVSNNKNNGGWNQLEKTQKSLRAQKEKFTLAAGGSNENGAHFMGSKMVEKVVKARKSGINNQAEKETKPKPLKYKV